MNGSDHATSKYVRALEFDCERIYQQQVEPVGVATTRLIQEASRNPSIDYILHMEDDWRACASDCRWLNRACEILEQYPGVGQVRLRRSDEKVLGYHMITRQPLQWEQQESDFRLSKSAHYTFNPSVIRKRDALRIFPCRDEHEAQIRFYATRLATVQLMPGVFRHEQFAAIAPP